MGKVLRSLDSPRVLIPSMIVLLPDFVPGYSSYSKLPWPSRHHVIQPLLASPLHLQPFSTLNTALLTFFSASPQGSALPGILYPCSSMNSSISSLRSSPQKSLDSLSAPSLLISELQYVISFIPYIPILMIHIDLLVFNVSLLLDYKLHQGRVSLSALLVIEWPGSTIRGFQ